MNRAQALSSAALRPPATGRTNTFCPFVCEALHCPADIAFDAFDFLFLASMAIHPDIAVMLTPALVFLQPSIEPLTADELSSAHGKMRQPRKVSHSPVNYV